MHRITKLRKSLNLKQIDLAKRILTTQGHISDIENGRKELTGRAIKLICSEFNVREDWLRTGNGEMFDTILEDELEGILSNYNLPDMGKRFVKSFIELDAIEMKAVLGFMEKVVFDNEKIDEIHKPMTPRKRDLKEKLEQTKAIVDEMNNNLEEPKTYRVSRAAQSINDTEAQILEMSADRSREFDEVEEVTELVDP